MKSLFPSIKKIKYEGPGGLIDRAGDTLSAAFVERLRGMADAEQHGAGDGGGGLLPTGAPLPAAGVREEIAEHVARVKEQGFTVIENVIPPELVAAIQLRTHRQKLQRRHLVALASATNRFYALDRLPDYR